MPYSAEITRSNPTCLVFLIDRSGSMAQPFGRQPERRKADGVADAINCLLSDLAIKCAKAEGIREYFHVAVLGYGQKVGSALGGDLAGRQLVSIGDIANHPLRVEERTRTEDDGTGRLLKRKVKFPVWVEPEAGGKTPLTEVLVLARQLVGDFLSRFPQCFPPLVLNVSDGMANQDPTPEARALMQLASADGNVLLFNAHLSEKTARPIEFPAGEAELPDKFAKLLFRMSSVLPPPFVQAARAEDYPVTDKSRGFVFNADLVAVIKFLEIGTQVAKNKSTTSGR